MMSLSMGKIAPCLLLSVFTLVICLDFCASASTIKDLTGHVCYSTISYKATIQESYLKTITEKYRSCHKVLGFLWRHCHTKERSRRIVAFRPTTVIRYRQIEKCCIGSLLIDGECVECPVGTYGYNCSMPCNCSTNGICDTLNGTCVCTEGWMDQSCQTPCAAGYYGLNCQQNCSYCHKMPGGANHTTFTSASAPPRCSAQTGRCDCSPGWFGYYCDKPCPNNTFGLACNETCSCSWSGSDTCDHVNGTCVCAPGYSGPRCDILVPTTAGVTEADMGSEERTEEQIDEEELNRGALAAFIIVPIILVIAGVLIAVLLVRRKRRKDKGNDNVLFTNAVYEVPNGGTGEAVYSSIEQPRRGLSGVRALICRLSGGRIYSRAVPRHYASVAGRGNPSPAASDVTTDVSVGENAYEDLPDGRPPPSSHLDTPLAQPRPVSANHYEPFPGAPPHPNGAASKPIDIPKKSERLNSEASTYDSPRNHSVARSGSQESEADSHYDTPRGSQPHPNSWAQHSARSATARSVGSSSYDVPPSPQPPTLQPQLSLPHPASAPAAESLYYNDPARPTTAEYSKLDHTGRSFAPTPLENSYEVPANRQGDEEGAKGGDKAEYEDIELVRRAREGGGERGEDAMTF